MALRVLHRGAPAQQDELEQAARLFNQKFADREWTAAADFFPSSAGNYIDKLLSLMASDSLPDSFYVNGENLAMSPAWGPT